MKCNFPTHKSLAICLQCCNETMKCNRSSNYLRYKTFMRQSAHLGSYSQYTAPRIIHQTGGRRTSHVNHVWGFDGLSQLFVKVIVEFAIIVGYVV